MNTDAHEYQYEAIREAIPPPAATRDERCKRLSEQILLLTRQLEQIAQDVDRLAHDDESSRPAKSTRPDRPDRPEKSDRPDRPEKPAATPRREKQKPAAQPEQPTELVAQPATEPDTLCTSPGAIRQACQLAVLDFADKIIESLSQQPQGCLSPSLPLLLPPTLSTTPQVCMTVSKTLEEGSETLEEGSETLEEGSETLEEGSETLEEGDSYRCEEALEDPTACLDCVYSEECKQYDAEGYPIQDDGEYDTCDGKCDTCDEECDMRDEECRTCDAECHTYDEKLNP